MTALQAAGLSRHAIDTRCRNGGPWQRLFGAVVLLHRARPSREQLLHAALAHLGPGAVVTGVDALRRYGAAPELPSAPVQVLVPANRRTARPPDIHVERTTRLPRTIEFDGLPFATPARACIDAARLQADGTRIDRILVAALRDGLCALPELTFELDDGSPRGAAAVRHRLRALSDKLASITEARARRIVAACRIPAPCWRAELHDEQGRPLTVVPAYWPEAGLSWDITPSGHHATLLRTTGATVLHTPPGMLLTDPVRVRRNLEHAYLRAGREPDSRELR